MYLKEAYEIAFESRDSWREGGGASTARINANHVMRILGLYLDVSEVDTPHFKKLTEVCRKEGKSPATINRITSSLSTLINELRQLGHKLSDIKFKRQKESQGRPHYYKEEEIDQLLDVARTQFDDHMLLHDTIMFAFKTGCRRGELFKLTWNNIDFDEGTIEFLDTKTGHDHCLKMHEDLVTVLKRREDQAIDDRVFGWNRADQILSEFKKCQELADIKTDKVFHTIRHTTATVLCKKGVPLRTVMGVMNHTNVNTTLRYAKPADDAVAAAIDLL